MKRRTALKALAALPLFTRLPVSSKAAVGVRPARWVRPGEPGWPSPAQWAALGESVGGRLVQVQSAFAVCEPDVGGTACSGLFQNLLDPFYIDQSVNLTQTLGWTGAFTSQPSAYAVLAAGRADVAAAVNFAREHNVRLVVKGGGHSYLGTSNAADSLLIWTRHNMQAVELHDSFVPQGCAGVAAPGPAVSAGAGCIWIDAYNAVTTIGGRYVQGGGCTTVGVAGLTKGGGGGTFGVVTRITLRTHPLPDHLGAVAATISAGSDVAYQALVAQMISFYRESLFKPHWGEQLHFGPGSQLTVAMNFQGLTQAQAEQTWTSFFNWARLALPITSSLGRRWERSRGSTTVRLSWLCGDVFPGQPEEADFLGCWLVGARCFKSGGDDDAAELGGHVGGGWLGLAGVPRRGCTAFPQVGWVVAGGRIPGNGDGLAGDLERDGPLDGGRGAVAGLPGAEDLLRVFYRDFNAPP